MATVGFDIGTPATDDLIQKASSWLESPPLFIGRYFKGPGNKSSVQYQPELENPVLSKSKLRVMCLGRQTTTPPSSEKDGNKYGTQNIAAVVDAFGFGYLIGLDIEPLIFLDVEPENPVSVEYWTGWAGACRAGFTQGDKTIRFTPAIYINHGDARSWDNLKTAVDKGAECACAWVALYIPNDKDTKKPPPPTPVWDYDRVAPKLPTVAPCPILFWQYVGDYYKKTFDFTVVKPGAEGAAMIHLMIVPPPK